MWSEDNTGMCKYKINDIIYGFSIKSIMNKMRDIDHKNFK